MDETTSEQQLRDLLRIVRDNPGTPRSLKAAAEMADELRKLRDTLEMSETVRTQLEAELDEAQRKLGKAGKGAAQSPRTATKPRDRMNS